MYIYVCMFLSVGMLHVNNSLFKTLIRAVTKVDEICMMCFEEKEGSDLKVGVTS